MKNKMDFQKSSTNNLSSQKTVLDNGITVITDKANHYKSFALGIFINAGSRDDENNKIGTAHFVEHLIFRKSKKFNSKQIANKFEEYGAYTNAYTTQELTCFYVRALKPHLRKSINLLCEIVFNPDFQKREADIERQIIIEEIKSYEDDIEENISDLGDKLIFGEHSLGNPILGTIDSVKKILINDLQNFHDKYYNPANIVFCVVGDIDHEKFCNLISNSVLNLKTNKNYRNKREKPVIDKARTTTIERHIKQSHLLLLNQIPDTNSQEKYPIGVLNTIFGDGMSSRLYQNLRDKYGFAYTIYSSIQLYSDIGTFSIYAAVDSSKLEFIRNLLANEIQKLEKISEKELKRGKEQYITGITLDTESLSSRMQSLAKTEFTNGKIESIELISQRIHCIEKVDLLEVAHKYIINKEFFELSIVPITKKKNIRQNK
ncbi:MAG TPA: pitrilysin family protein [Candidatus Kapabacteria bacterium]|nr:pitrilysin family protein [Candidatus Kapabacteria bacterium]